MVQDEPRHRGIEGLSLGKLEERTLLESGAVGESRAASASPAHHLARQIDPLQPVSRVEERLAHEPWTAARIQHPRAGRKRGKRDQPRERSRILLDGRLLESRRLSVERLLQGAVVILHCGGL